MIRNRRTRRLALVTRYLAVQFQKVSKNLLIKFWGIHRMVRINFPR